VFYYLTLSFMLLCSICFADEIRERSIAYSIPSDLEGDLAILRMQLNSNAEKEEGLQVDFQGFSIAANGSATVKFGEIVSWDGFDFFVVSVSSGNISTANLISYQSDRVTVLSQQVITSGTSKLPDSNFISFVVDNNVSENITVTMSIVGWDGNSPTYTETGLTKTSSIDLAGRHSLNTVFGEQITGKRVSSVAAQFQYPLPSDFATSVTANGGTWILDDALSVLSSGTSSNGTASVQTNQYLRYIPGHEAYLVYTASYSTPNVNSHQRVGLFDTQDGMWIGYEGADFVIARRRDGVDYRTTVNVSNIYMDGTFDTAKLNVYRISFGYLGVATIHFEAMTPGGGWVVAGEIPYPNTSTVTHISQTYLPARIKVGNTGSTSNVSIKSGSFELGIVDGGGSDPSVRTNSYSSSNISVSSGDFEIVSFRNKTTYGGIENRVTAKLLYISWGTAINKQGEWLLENNPTTTNTPTWTDVDTQDSILEYSTDIQVTRGTGKTELSWISSAVDSGREDIPERYEIKIRPGEYAVLSINTATGASGELAYTFRWAEEF